MKNFIAALFALVLVFSLSSCMLGQKQAYSAGTGTEAASIIRFDRSVALVDTGKKKFSGISVSDAVRDMTVGWNLGNTLDATDGGNSLKSETSWGQPKTTQTMIYNLAASGIKTLRLPVSWAHHMNKDDYTVDPAWMARVKEIVDWAIDEDMYVIINSHHDNGESASSLEPCGGYYPNSNNYEESERFLVNLWSQIALAFNNGYDEHLVFETMNEPRLRNTANEWRFNGGIKECRDAADCLNRLNQACVDAIRNSGGNNKKRFISIPALQASTDSAFSGYFKMPEDKKEGRLILSVHMYTPYSFAMETPGARKYTSGHKVELKEVFDRLNKNYVEKGYPVIVGEYGATNKNNLDARVAWFKDFISISRQYGITCCLWDNGVWELAEDSWDFSEHYGYYNRREGTWYFPEILEAIVSSAK